MLIYRETVILQYICLNAKVGELVYVVYYNMTISSKMLSVFGGHC